jgi:hypothetical protein
MHTTLTNVELLKRFKIMEAAPTCFALQRNHHQGATASFFPPGATQPIVGVYFTALYRALASSSTRLLDRTQRRATVGRTPLNE